MSLDVLLSFPSFFFIFGTGPGGRAELAGLYPGPYFDLERNQENVSAHVGTHAYLPCYVKQLGNKSVSIFPLLITCQVS